MSVGIETRDFSGPFRLQTATQKLQKTNLGDLAHLPLFKDEIGYTSTIWIPV